MLFSQFTIWTLLAATSVALPSPQAIQANAPDVSNIEARAAPDKIYQDAVKAIKAFGPDPTKTIMWSFIGPAKASKYAKKSDSQIVENAIYKAVVADKNNEYKDTLKKYCVKKEDFCDSEDGKGKKFTEAWEAIGKAWAKYARKDTILAIAKHGDGPVEKTYFNRIQRKILEENNVRVTVDNEIY